MCIATDQCLSAPREMLRKLSMTPYMDCHRLWRFAAFAGGGARATQPFTIGYG
jgi:hypothetical protein